MYSEKKIFLIVLIFIYYFSIIKCEDLNFKETVSKEIFIKQYKNNNL